MKKGKHKEYLKKQTLTTEKKSVSPFIFFKQKDKKNTSEVIIRRKRKERVKKQLN